MENSKPLATESFSYSWLIDRKPPSSHDLLNNLIPNFFENSNEKEQNFNFDIPITASPAELVHAHEIFSDGQIMPVYIDRSKVEETLKTSTSVLSSPISLYPSRNPFFANKNQYYLLGKWRKSSKKILQKCFGFVKPLCKAIGSSRKSNRVNDLDRKVFELESLSNSLEVSPRPSSAYSAFEWSDVKKIGNGCDFYRGLEKVKSWRCSPQVSPNISPSRSSNVWCDDENSIHEAILYCKRSIEN